MPDIEALQLNVEKSNDVSIYTDEFIKKAKINLSKPDPSTDLSDKETEWAVNCIDNMVKGLYTEEELKRFKEEGIDPAAGILIDGKPVDLYQQNQYTYSFDEPSKNPRAKCKILAQALSGKEIDVIKYEFDKDGFLQPTKTVPVQTQVKKVSEKKTSWFRRLLESIGLVSPSINKKLNETNKKPRDRSSLFQDSVPSKEERDKTAADLNDAKQKQANKQLDNINVKLPEKADMLSTAKRQAISTQLRGESVKRGRKINSLDFDFFGSQFEQEKGKTLTETINRKIDSKFKLTTADNRQVNSFRTLDRSSSRVSLAIIYGLSQGHTFDEIIAPENYALRQRLGKEVIENLGTKTIQEFAKDNNLVNDIRNPETKRQYQEYFIQHTAKLADFYTKGYEGLRKEECNFPDANNFNDIIKKFERFELLGMIGQDFTQSSMPLRKNAFDKTSAEAENSRKRYEALMNYMDIDVGVLSASHESANKYISFIANKDFVDVDVAARKENINIAARGKAALEFYHEKSKDMDCMARFMDNEETAKQFVSFRSYDGAFLKDEELSKSAYSNYLCTQNPEAKAVLFNEENLTLTHFSKETPTGKTMSSIGTANTYEKNKQNACENLKEYIEYINVIKENGTTLDKAFQNSQLEHPISEAEKSAMAADTAERNARIEREEKIAAERERPLTESEIAAKAKEEYINSAVKNGVSRDNAEQIWKAEEHSKKVNAELESLIADDIHIDNSETTKQKMSFDELNNTTKKLTMPPKSNEIKTPEKQMSGFKK
ncbi:MAG: hypothetical protein J6C38_05035 [Oscillospiraceae bacterium]|nr:hypothetical protein [Oscillospiraceae bacterium]